MRVLVDKCVDWRILRDLTDHDAQTVKQLGWEHIDDGALAAQQFDVFLTVDKDLPREQNIASFEIAVVVLRGRTTRLVLNPENNTYSKNGIRAFSGEARSAISTATPSSPFHNALRRWVVVVAWVAAWLARWRARWSHSVAPVCL